VDVSAAAAAQKCCVSTACLLACRKLQLPGFFRVVVRYGYMDQPIHGSGFVDVIVNVSCWGARHCRWMACMRHPTFFLCQDMLCCIWTVRFLAPFMRHVIYGGTAGHCRSPPCWPALYDL